MRFRDRREAGRLLAQELESYRGDPDAIVLGVPRGGVVVAYEVARKLDLPLDIYITRKIGAPYNPELALGAVTSDGTVLLDQDIIDAVHVPEGYVEQETEREKAEIERRVAAYRGDRPPPSLRGKRVILVDDGVATGATLIASLRALRQAQPAELIVAIPVGPADTIRRIQSEADRVVYLSGPQVFWALSMFYEDFRQTTDTEVQALLQAGRYASSPPAVDSEA